MTAGIIILCRSSSSRLPNKIFKDISGQPALLHTVQQAQMLFSDSQIVVATSNHQSDNEIEQLCKANDINCFRGSLTNVAERFYLCALQYKFDYAIRLNGDNIFVNRELMARMTQDALENNTDFVSNVKDRTFPKGLSIEIIKTKAMGKCIAQINQQDDFKEHVLYYFYENGEITRKFYYADIKIDSANVSFALDTKEDLNRIRKITTQLGDNYPNYTYKELLIAYEHLER